MCGEIKNLYNDYPFLKEVDSCCLRCTVFNLEDAFKNYYSKRSNYPRFKSKFNKQSYRTTCIKSTYKNREYSNIELDLVNRKIKLPKIGLVDIRGYRNLKKISWSIINTTIEKETTNKYYVSVVVEEKEFVPSSNVIPQNIVGIDLGVKTFYVDGNIINDKTITINTKILYGNYCGDTCLPGYAYYLTVPVEGSTPIFVSDAEGEFIVTEEKYNEISSKIPITTFTFERDDLGNYGLKSVKIK